MFLRRNSLWSTAQYSLLCGFVGMIGILAIASITDPNIPSWLPLVSKIPLLIFGFGGLITWGYGIKFYARVNQELGVKRSAIYLVIVVCFNWISPYIYIALEGKDRFFDRAPESQ